MTFDINDIRQRLANSSWGNPEPYEVEKWLLDALNLLEANRKDIVDIMTKLGNEQLNNSSLSQENILLRRNNAELVKAISKHNAEIDGAVEGERMMANDYMNRMVDFASTLQAALMKDGFIIDGSQMAYVVSAIKVLRDEYLVTSQIPF